ncbi:MULTISPECIES: flagellar biosynthesis regulator FlaF [unclassified Paracoccus (in: a-proteobacteria)]|uniref:flagellar biosynthesis regulator FlaF n=1 Tax=unclassified Paracoccus (in: a-proteobacteria) TaxID=2688777 RepID=UPI00160090FA|nr:flagellar biosynthesis regulator FlaF [Paracoccus sp. MC1862]MBB1491718.1 flagellar biosynthesis regulator FlaF [Paracoccus sp. MC1854]MBB1499224.1 flagellar biosynthesis regulator FlaF [Paracoccus sp. MC1862]QQO44856.1 flagellar biosynthesis regulator FlaF [Paracoccus sp. MC1862]
MNAQVPYGYGTAASVEADPRRAEALILSKLAAGMIRASEPGSSFAAMPAAVHENRRFWRIAAEDLTSEGNSLPVPLRAQLLSIAGFVEKETSRILAGETSAAALVEINRAVARGLFEQPPG